MSTLVIWNGFPAKGEGQIAEVFDATRAENAGSSEKIRRIVTEVERYHSCYYLLSGVP